ncbi:MAG: hypothetical protein WC666_03475 [Candidatus Paceibacterota bacterium]|jgi:hypothetical protein
MSYQYVKEPLSDPANTIELLITETLHQAFELAGPINASSHIEGIVAEFKAKAGIIIECKKTLDLLKAEILRRFAELEQRVKVAEQTVREKS